MIDGFAVDQRMGSGGIIADHAPQGGAAGGGDIRAELLAVRPQGRIELLQDDARFDVGLLPRGVEFQDAVHMTGKIEDQGPRDRLSGETGAAASRQDGNAMSGGNFDCGDNVGMVQGKDDTQWLDLVDAGVGAVETPGHLVEADFAPHDVGQVRFELPLQINLRHSHNV